MLKLVAELLITILLVGSLIILNFVIFKIQIKGNDKQIAILAVIVGATNFYSKFIVHSSIYLYIQLLVYIIVLAALRRYPILYSIIVCAFGSFAASVIDGVWTIGAIQLKLSTTDKMANDFTQFILFHLLSSLTYLILARILYSKNIGFEFVRRRFSGKHAMKMHNYIWLFIVVVGTITLQLTNDKLNVNTLHGYIFIGLFIVLVVSLYYSYNQNKKSLKDRYGKK